MYLIGAAACLGASIIYHLFGHGVRSPEMLLCFLWPLLGGAVPAAALPKLGIGWAGPGLKRLWASGLAAMAVDGFLAGIFRIAGIPGEQGKLIQTAGICMLCIGAIWFAALALKAAVRGTA